MRGRQTDIQKDGHGDFMIESAQWGRFSRNYIFHFFGRVPIIYVQVQGKVTNHLAVGSEVTNHLLNTCYDGWQEEGVKERDVITLAVIQLEGQDMNSMGSILGISSCSCSCYFSYSFSCYFSCSFSWYLSHGRQKATYIQNIIGIIYLVDLRPHSSSCSSNSSIKSCPYLCSC